MTASGGGEGTNVLIAAGGVAGAALGAHLAHCGRQVQILEASRAMHNNVCDRTRAQEALRTFACTQGRVKSRLGTIGAA